MFENDGERKKPVPLFAADWGYARGTFAFSGGLAVGAVAVGGNAVGTIVAIGGNAVAPISFAAINGVGIITVAGVNGLGAWSFATINHMGNPVVALVASGIYVVASVIMIAVKATRRAVAGGGSIYAPEPASWMPLVEVNDQRDVWTRGCLRRAKEESKSESPSSSSEADTSIIDVLLHDDSGRVLPVRMSKEILAGLEVVEEEKGEKGKKGKNGKNGKNGKRAEKHSKPAFFPAGDVVVFVRLRGLARPAPTGSGAADYRQAAATVFEFEAVDAQLAPVPVPLGERAGLLPWNNWHTQLCVAILLTVGLLMYTRTH